MREVAPATGTAKLVLIVTTNAKRGKKTVKNKVEYTVTNLNPDPRVAFPAWALTKADGEVYHVAVDVHGPMCSCPHYTFRGSNSKAGCKHVLALQAVGLLPKE